MTRCASCGLMQRSKKSIIRLSCRRAIRAPCGNFKADRPRGLEIDDQLEVRRLLDRYIGTLGSAQNFSRQSCPLSQELGEPRTIANLCITANLGRQCRCWVVTSKSQIEQMVYSRQPTSAKCAGASRSCHRLHSAAYSMTSSARERMVGGTSTPIAFATLALMTNSNLMGC